MTALGNHDLSYLNDDFVTEKYGVGIQYPNPRSSEPQKNILIVFLLRHQIQSNIHQPN